MNVARAAILFLIQPPPWIEILWVAISISVHNSVGNFAPFFEVGIGAYLDGRRRTYWLIPLLLLTFMLNTLICTKALINLCISKVARKKRHAWTKTLHDGKGNCYLKGAEARARSFTILLFLPAILELKRPREPGSRKIAEIASDEDD